MTTLGESLMNTIEALTGEESPRKELTPERYREIIGQIEKLLTLRKKQGALLDELAASLRYKMRAKYGRCNKWGRGPGGGAVCVLWKDHEGVHEFPPGSVWPAPKARR